MGRMEEAKLNDVRSGWPVTAGDFVIQLRSGKRTGAILVFESDGKTRRWHQIGPGPIIDESEIVGWISAADAGIRFP